MDRKSLAVVSLIVLLAAIAALLSVGCVEDQRDTGAIAYKRGPDTPADYGNGILYFEVRGEVFMQALSRYLDANPDKEVVSVAPDDRCGYGNTCGYIVVVREREPCPACQATSNSEWRIL